MSNKLCFWAQLKKPVFVLAPMADVTDAAFRRVIAKYGRPDVMWTEFVSADGLMSPGREVLLKDLMYTEAERPIVAQLFGANPEKMRGASELVERLGFDGLDINMGCPDRSIEKQGAGAAMMKDPKLAKEIIQAARDGAPNLPISVKTRIGYNKDEIDTWIPALLKENLATLTVHLRTRKEMSLVPAKLEKLSRIIALRDKISPETLILGNGDVVDLDDAQKKVESSGADGVMLGRAIFGNPWLFSKSSRHLEEILPADDGNIFIQEKLRVMVEHTKLFEELLGEVKNFAIMKKHYKAYVNGFEGAKELRNNLMEAENAREVERIVSLHMQSVASRALHAV